MQKQLLIFQEKRHLQKSNSSVNRAVSNCWDSNSNVANTAQDDLLKKKKKMLPQYFTIKKKKIPQHDFLRERVHFFAGRRVSPGGWKD